MDNHLFIFIKWNPSFLILILVGYASCTRDHEAMLYRKLLDNRLPVRPRPNGTEPTQIYVAFYLNQIKELDGAKQELSVSGTISLTWYDDELSWNPGDYGGIDHIWMLSKNIWKPLFDIKNGISSPDFSDFLEKRPVLVTANGSVSWTLSGYFYTSCDVNFFYFPFDIQTCDIILVDTKSNWETQLIPSEDSVYLNLLMGNSKWGFLDSLVSVYTDAMALTFTNVRISLSMRRAPICFFTTMLLPVWLLSIVSVLALSLQPECGEKISLSIACLMAFFLTQVTISDHMPTNWTVMPLIMRFNFTNMMVNVMSVCMAIAGVNLHLLEPLPDIPPWVYRIFFTLKQEHDLKYGNKIQDCSTARGQEAGDGENEVVAIEALGNEGNDASVLSDILFEIRKITATNEKKAKETEVQEKWKDIVRSVNKIVFYAFALIWSLICVISTVVWSRSEK